MKGCVFDLEATGLLDNMLREGGHIHCLMLQEVEINDKEITKGRCVEFYDEVLPAEGCDTWIYGGGLADIPDGLRQYSFIAGHHVLGYDFPVLKHHLGFVPEVPVIDSLVVSRKNFPDRPGGHSVQAWGPRLGQSKLEQEDWTVMSVDVRRRCRTDVELETDILISVMNEMWRDVERCNV